MVTPRMVGIPALKLLLALLAGSAIAEARIGDTPDQMAGRMLRPNLGKYFSWREFDERTRERMVREHPITPFLHLLPEKGGEWREDVFWKSALSRQLSNDDGWRVHVYYLRGQSVLECYRRVGNKLSEAEVNAILSRLRGGDTWRKEEKKSGPETVLGYDYQLGQGSSISLRARQQGDWLIIYHKRFDDFLMERKKLWDADEEKRKAEERVEQEKRAPVSVEGF